MYLASNLQHGASVTSLQELPYLSARIIVSPPKSNQRLCISESKYGCEPYQYNRPSSTMSSPRGGQGTRNIERRISYRSKAVSSQLQE